MKHYYFQCNILCENYKQKGTNLTILVEANNTTDAQKIAENCIRKRSRFSGNIKDYKLTLSDIDLKKKGICPLQLLENPIDL